VCGIKTKHTCRFGESGIGRTSGGWKFPELTLLRLGSAGNFQPPSVHPIPDSPNLQICLFKALLEDKKVFQNILKSKVYQASVKAIVIDEAHLVEEW
jgi:hypothetical protein